MSGGQKQRLCIARALLKHPKVIIFDDSTSAVDMATDAQIRAALAELTGVTKIIIAQRVNSVEDADQIVVLDDGRVDAVGTHDELLATCEIYREIYTSQQYAASGDGVDSCTAVASGDGAVSCTAVAACGHAAPAPVGSGAVPAKGGER